MPSQQWQRAEDLFLAAADLSEGERAAFLVRECGGDGALRAEVESLLAFDRAPRRSIADVLEAAATSLLGSGELTGKRLGPYRITGRVGVGGMGAVYLAGRDDDQFNKRVAIKLLKSSLAPGYLRERLRQERQILAGLDHPYIARLLDGGTTDDGAPYFVMEYVEGLPIDTYCDLHSATIEQRITLFRKACEAVSYAHRNLVIHRDLKPSHILVDQDGMPKLLDFGIAKLLNTGGDETATATVHWVLTPDYASPEQVRREAVSTATDVYSLGAVLYRLLTGVNPHALESYTPLEIERVVCRDEPARPSLAAADAGRRKRLTGDLDNIVLMAMRKEPERRYASVEQLSEDLRRYLAGLPVSAQQDTVRYRTGKFLRRHRGAAAAALLAVLGLTGGATAALWEAHRAHEARLIAERQREEAVVARHEAEIERARALLASGRAEGQAREADAQRKLAQERLKELVELANRSVFDIQDAIERLPGATEARRKIAKTTLEFLQDLAQKAGDDPRVLCVLTQAYMRLGDVQGLPLQASLGDYGAALESYRKSYAILDKLPPDTELRVRRAGLDYRIGRVLITTSKTQEGFASLERGLRIARAVERDRPGNGDAIQTAASIAAALTEQYRQFDLAKATFYAEALVASERKLAGLRPKNDDTIRGLADAYCIMGTTRSLSGDLQQALADARTCAGIREDLVRRRPNDAGYQRDLMLAYGHIGDRLGNPFVANLGDRASAKVYFEKARKVVEPLAAADRVDGLAQSDLAVVLMRIGAVAEKPEERDEALAVLRQAARIFEQMAKSQRPSRPREQNLSLTYEYLGRRLSEGGDFTNALAYFQKSLAIAERHLAADPQFGSAQTQIFSIYHAVAVTRARQGNRAGALAQIDQAREMARRVTAPGANMRALMQRWPATVESWLGEIHELFARVAPPEQRRAEWNSALEAYTRSQALWAAADEFTHRRYQAEIGQISTKVLACARLANGQ